MKASIHYLINKLIESKQKELSKLKKDELKQFISILLKDYYYELDDSTIKELYNEQI